jgi:hypothetical protein
MIPPWGEDSLSQFFVNAEQNERVSALNLAPDSNPLRVELVKDLKELEKYPYCGHGTVLGTLARQ